VKIKDLPRVNYEIRSKRVKLIDENRKLLGEFDIQSAIRLAQDRGYDLVEVAPNANPPICRILNFGRYIYEKKRQERQSRKRQHRPEVKEMRISLKISEHDYQVKLTKIKEFLNDGDRVKLKLRLRGREMLHADLGMKVVERVIADLETMAKLESPPKQEDQMIIATFIPQKRKREE